VAHVSLGEQRHLPPPLDVDNYDKKYGLTENLLGTLVNAFNAEALVVCQHSIEPLPDVEPADLKFLACADVGADHHNRSLQNFRTTEPPESLLRGYFSPYFRKNLCSKFLLRIQQADLNGMLPMLKRSHAIHSPNAHER
jgi:hypothetical protein